MVRRLPDDWVSEEDITQLQNDMEFWSEDDILRFGFDVQAGECIELRISEFEAFKEALQSENSVFKQEFEGRDGMLTYLIEIDGTTVHVYNNQSHVAVFNDYEHFPLPDIEHFVRELEIDWDVEDVARKVVQGVVGELNTVRVDGVDEHIARVVVESDFFKKPLLLNLASLSSRQSAYHPESVEAESFGAFKNQVSTLLDGVNVHVEDDGTVQYIVRIDTQMALDDRQL